MILVSETKTKPYRMIFQVFKLVFFPLTFVFLVNFFLGFNGFLGIFF